MRVKNYCGRAEFLIIANFDKQKLLIFGRSGVGLIYFKGKKAW
jgi:hypothetical protein